MLVVMILIERSKSRLVDDIGWWLEEVAKEKRGNISRGGGGGGGEDGNLDEKMTPMWWDRAEGDTRLART